MNDPLGMLGSVTRAGNAAGVGAAGMPAGDGPAPTGGKSFKDVLLDNIRQVNDLQQQATSAVEDLTSGRRNDLEGVLLATQKADTAFKLLLAVRNKMQAAYEEVKQLRV